MHNYSYTHTHTHTHIYIYIYLHIYIYIYAQKYTYLYSHCLSLSLSLFLSVYLSLCLCLSVRLSLIYAHIHLRRSLKGFSGKFTTIFPNMNLIWAGGYCLDLSFQRVHSDPRCMPKFSNIILTLGRFYTLKNCITMCSDILVASI